MNPYKTPESNLEHVKGELPNSILVVYYLIAVSFIIFLIEEFLDAAYSETGVYDLYNYIFIPIWIIFLFWFWHSIHKRKENPKYTFLLLAFVVSGMNIYDPLGPYSMYAGLGEAACFFIIFFLLNRKTSKEWFE